MEIREIKVESISPHPQNPRIVCREDVVTAIQAGLGKGFHPSHALQVMPSGGSYIVLSGHHRLEAAKRAGLNIVPCWVRDDIDDDQAFMLLATDNNQGELSPLEIGIHALNYVGKATGGRGKTGGLSEYARAVGKWKRTISEYLSAAKVAKNCSVDRTLLLDKSQHKEVKAPNKNYNTISCGVPVAELFKAIWKELRINFTPFLGAN